MSDASREYAWGPSFDDNAGTRFRIWAPAERSVFLRLGTEITPMARRDNGWFESEIRERPFGLEYGFVLSDGTLVPDPASRHQTDVLGMSRLIDSNSYEWKQGDWKGRRWEEAVFYEIHIGTFTMEGTFRAATERLAYLADIGFTAVEIMPLAHFPGERGWGYDGVFHYAPFSHYGTADDLKAFADTAHEVGLMVFLDVVYNHFGPAGNFLSKYAPGFFQDDNPTPWGTRIAFANEPVRRFFIDNAIYWLAEHHLDGLRLDAIDQIEDKSPVHILEQLSNEVHAEISDRTIHLITENPANGTDLMAERSSGRRLYKADWNDDFHHAIHSAVTGEDTGYYMPLAKEAWKNTARALAQGHLKEGRRILPVEPPHPSCLPTTCFVDFLQNHDQVGNRAVGDRLHQSLDRDLYAALVEVLVLSPQIPLFFQGDDHLSGRPFRFFADYEGEVRSDIWKNRETEALNFGGFPDGVGPEDIPDPSDPATFHGCKLVWEDTERSQAREWKVFLKRLLSSRARHIVPLIGASMRGGRVLDSPERCLFIDWDHSTGVLQLRANLSETALELGGDLGQELYPGRSPDYEARLFPYSTRIFNHPQGGFLNS
jgi:maltooligosyltrehalose trehalohydrolase